MKKFIYLLALFSLTACASEAGSKWAIGNMYYHDQQSCCDIYN